MIWGGDDGLPLKRQDAAKAVGLADVTLRQALANPMVLQYYNRELDVLRTGERPRSIQRIAELRDKAESERVSLEAAKYLDGGDKRDAGAGVIVNVGVTPGYMVDVGGLADPKLLQMAGSRRSILETDTRATHGSTLDADQAELPDG